MSMIHASRGVLKPAGVMLKSECAVVAGIAQAALPQSVVAWSIWWKIMIAFAMTLKLCCQSSPTITSASVIPVVFT